VERKLAAILAADVVGYSRLMAENEADTFDRLRAYRNELFEPEIAKHHGRIFKLMGDGLLAEFGSVVDAVECGVVLQREMALRNKEVPEDRRILVRIGINLGDVIVDGEDRHGDGVNIAARLQEIAEPGGLAVSGTTYDHLQGKVGIALEFAGEQQVKNIARPVRVYRARLDRPVRVERPTLALPDKPSIAVLPFQNLSGEPEQEYFADGIVEEIITALSRFRQLFVIACNSSFTYKGRPVDVKQVGRELGVRYVLEGSLRRASGRVRITGQLIEAATGVHLWAERFDGALEDIFDLQDQLTANVVGAITPKLEQVELERARRKPTDSLDAYDYYLRALVAVHQWTREANDEALSHFYKAIELDPKFAAAYGWAARCYSQRKVGGWVTNPAKEVAEAGRLARLAAQFGHDDAVALCTAGIALAKVVGDTEGGLDFTERALSLNPNLVWAWFFSGWVQLQLNKPDVAIERFNRAMRLNPNDPQMYATQDGMAAAHFVARRYAEAVSWAKAALREKPDFVPSMCVAAASAAYAEQISEAHEMVARLRELDPTLRISRIKDPALIEFGGNFDRFADGLRKAGLPE
jgi:TolB-like protein